MAANTILVVDPDPDLTKLLAYILEEEGHKVTSAQSLTQAVDLLSKTRFDLIVTEAFGQTEVFSFDPSFLAELSSLAGGTPIILFSTYAADNAIRPGDFGLAEIVPKPFDIDKLVAKVALLLGKA